MRDCDWMEVEDLGIQPVVFENEDGQAVEVGFAIKGVVEGEVEARLLLKADTLALLKELLDKAYQRQFWQARILRAAMNRGLDTVKVAQRLESLWAVIHAEEVLKGG